MNIPKHLAMFKEMSKSLQNYAKMLVKEHYMPFSDARVMDIISDPVSPNLQISRVKPSVLTI